MIERQHLEILRAVQRQGTLTEAAESLCLTQSALSHAIHKLEQRLGCALWTKEGRQLRFTPAGEYLLALANRFVPQFEHAERTLAQMAAGERGTLRIGIECHPCNDWLSRVVGPYLQSWPDVEVDVRREFQFGGIAALFNHEIDLLVTPDPLERAGLRFEPVFDYEQVLVVNRQHPLAVKAVVEPSDLADQTLLTYPVEAERLDIYRLFLLPAGVALPRRKTIETTEILMHMVAVGRGVTAAPDWIAKSYARTLPLVSLRLGPTGIRKQIHLGIRANDHGLDYVAAFLEQAKAPERGPQNPGRPATDATDQDCDQ